MMKLLIPIVVLLVIGLGFVFFRSIEIPLIMGCCVGVVMGGRAILG